MDGEGNHVENHLVLFCCVPFKGRCKDIKDEEVATQNKPFFKLLPFHVILAFLYPFIEYLLRHILWYKWFSFSCGDDACHAS
jgi:hypothetical protein